MRIPVFDVNGKRTEEILEVDEKVFGGEVRKVVLKESILMYEARQRLGTHSTKTRGQTSGSGRKLWRQKGTGRARVGPARAPHWRGGGKVFTPHPRDYSYSIPKKARHVALNSAWLAKFLDRQVLVVEDLSVNEPKTSKITQLLKALGIHECRTLVGVTEANDNLWKSVRNIEKVSYDLISRFSPYQLLRNHRVLISRKSLENLVTSRGGSVKKLKRSELYSKTSKAKK